MSTQQRFDKTEYSIKNGREFDREEAHLFTSSTSSQRRERCSHKTILRKALREHRLYINNSQLSHKPSQLNM